MGISGSVSGREAVVSLSVVDSNGAAQPVEALVDTGFTGYLMLPASMTERLGLAPRAEKPVILADGSVASFQTYYATIEWHDGRRSILVYEVEARPLIGMSLLTGSRLLMDIVEGGTVSVEPVPA